NGLHLLAHGRPVAALVLIADLLHLRAERLVEGLDLRELLVGEAERLLELIDEARAIAAAAAPLILRTDDGHRAHRQGERDESDARELHGDPPQRVRSCRVAPKNGGSTATPMWFLTDGAGTSIPNSVTGPEK